MGQQSMDLTGLYTFCQMSDLLQSLLPSIMEKLLTHTPTQPPNLQHYIARPFILWQPKKVSSDYFTESYEKPNLPIVCTHITPNMKAFFILNINLTIFANAQFLSDTNLSHIRCKCFIKFNCEKYDKYLFPSSPVFSCFSEYYSCLNVTLHKKKFHQLSKCIPR